MSGPLKIDLPLESPLARALQGKFLAFEFVQIQIGGERVDYLGKSRSPYTETDGSLRVAFEMEERR